MFLQKRFESTLPKVLLLVVTFVLAMGWLELIQEPFKFLFGVDLAGRYVGNFVKAFFVSCVLVPVVEEVMFRLPLEYFRVMKPKLLWIAVIWSSVVFGVMHFGVASAYLQGVLGLLMAINYLKSGFGYAVLFHGAWNFYAVFLN